MKKFDTHSIADLRALMKNRVADELEVGSLRRACVLIPLIPHDHSWQLLFSRRSAELAVHSGQISFPGGGANPGEDLADAALREMHEEVGIDPSMVEVIGRLDDLVTRTGYVVAPFVGVVATHPEYVLQPSEVEEVFEVPISVLLAEGNPDVRYLRYKERLYPSYFYRTEMMEIWGLTGRILKSFLDLVRLTV